jgi:hypothetical protein
MNRLNFGRFKFKGRETKYTFNQELMAIKNPLRLFDFGMLPVCLPAFGNLKSALLKLAHDIEKTAYDVFTDGTRSCRPLTNMMRITK